MMPDGKKIWKILRKRNYGLLVKIVSWLNTYNGCYRNIPHYTTQTQRPYTLMVIMLVILYGNKIFNSIMACSYVYSW